MLTVSLWCSALSQSLKTSLQVRKRVRSQSFVCALLAMFLAFSPLDQALAKKRVSDDTTSVDASQTNAKKKKRKKKRAAALASAAAVGVEPDKTTAKKSKVQAAKAQTAKPKTVSDAELLKVYQAIQQGQSRLALELNQQLLAKAPNHRLLHLLQSDLLALRGKKNIALAASLTDAQKLRVSELQQEAWLRLHSQVKKPSVDAVPTALLQLADNEPYALVVDSAASRLYVYQNRPQLPPLLIGDYYTTLGKQGIYKNKEGDQRTPIGVYFIDGLVKQALPDLYGFKALNMDYPNAWDKRLGRTGYGIWLHGTPSETYTRAPYASDGCVVLSNPDLEQILQLNSLGRMPIVVTEKLEYVPEQQLKQDRQDALQALDAWRVAMQSGVQNQIAKLYGAQFKTDNYTRDAWLAKKIETHAAKKPVIISHVSVFRYPSENDMILMQFTESSPDGTASTAKQLYWKKEQREWKIFMEQTL